MKRTSLWIPQALLKQLAARTKETGVPAAEQIRRAITEYLSKK